MRRRHNPYSRRTEIESSRQAYRDIIVLVLLAGLLVNLVSGWLTSLLQRYVIHGDANREWLVYLLFLGVLLVSLVEFAARYHSRAETDKCRLELALPYCFSHEDGLHIKEQHRFRPQYAAAGEARRIFAVAYRSQQPERKRLAAEWLDAPAGSRVQPYLAEIHSCLVDALILQAIHKYCESSIGPEAIYDWYRVDMAAAKRTFEELPRRLRDNRFISSQQADSAGWALLLPLGVDLRVEENDEGWSWVLEHAEFGEVEMQCFAPSWARRAGQAIEVFGETFAPRGGKQPPQCDQLWVLGTRILITASFSRTMNPAVDPFHQWGTRLLAYLEEALDWGFFLSNRQARVVNDLPWKIGDLPTRNDSVWLKLDAIEKRLARLEKKE